MLFAERGFAGASMSDLARRCGVSKALIYHYYESKEDILFDIADRYTGELLRIAEEVVAKSEEASDKFERLIHAFMRQYESSQAHHRVLVQDVKFLTGEQSAVIRHRQRAIVQMFADTIATIRPGVDIEQIKTALAMLLFGMMNWTFTWLKPNGALSYESFADIVVQMFRGGLLALNCPTTSAAVSGRATTSLSADG